jgi:ABC-type branched-subunit amino acid transport system ATPase component
LTTFISFLRIHFSCFNGVFSHFAAEKEIKIGVIYPLSGALAMIGRDLQRAEAFTAENLANKMVAMGKGLMSDPKLLMLDEPSLGPMPILMHEMLEAVTKLKEGEKTLLLVE